MPGHAQRNLTRLLAINARLCKAAEPGTVMAQPQLRVLTATAIQVLSEKCRRSLISP